MDMNYSQNNEQQIILDFFQGAIGTVLDIGANDGKTLSNSRRVIELGWRGTLVEPSKKAFKKLSDLYADCQDVEVFNVAISLVAGEQDFYESGHHLTENDHSLLSSLKKEETHKWIASTEFKKTKVKCITIDDLVYLSKFRTFDLIT